MKVSRPRHRKTFPLEKRSFYEGRRRDPVSGRGRGGGGRGRIEEKKKNSLKNSRYRDVSLYLKKIYCPRKGEREREDRKLQLRVDHRDSTYETRDIFYSAKTDELFFFALEEKRKGKRKTEETGSRLSLSLSSSFPFFPG